MKRNYKYINKYIVVSFLYVISTCCYIFLFKQHVKDNPDIGLVLLSSYFVLLAYTLFSYRTINNTQIGCIIELGTPVEEVSGICLVPRFFCELKCESRLAIDTKFPNTFQKDPINITHGRRVENTNDPLNTRLTTTASISIRYKIVNYVDFVTEVDNTDRAAQELRDVLVNALATECARLPLANNLQNRVELNDSLSKAAKKYTENWGIEIIMVLHELDLGNEIQKAQNDVSVSISGISINENNSKKIYFEGHELSRAQSAIASAKAESILKLSEMLGIDDKLTLLKLETLTQILSKENTNLKQQLDTNNQKLLELVMTLYNSKDSQKVEYI